MIIKTILGLGGFVICYKVITLLQNKMHRIRKALILWSEYSLVLYPTTQFFSEIIWKRLLINYFVNYIEVVKTGIVVLDFVCIIVSIISIVFSLKIIMILEKNKTIKVLFMGK